MSAHSPILTFITDSSLFHSFTTSSLSSPLVHAHSTHPDRLYARYADRPVSADQAQAPLGQHARVAFSAPADSAIVQSVDEEGSGEVLLHPSGVDRDGESLADGLISLGSQPGAAPGQLDDPLVPVTSGMLTCLHVPHYSDTHTLYSSVSQADVVVVSLHVQHVVLGHLAPEARDIGGSATSWWRSMLADVLLMTWQMPFPRLVVAVDGLADSDWNQELYSRACQVLAEVLFNLDPQVDFFVVPVDGAAGHNVRKPLADSVRPGVGTWYPGPSLLEATLRRRALPGPLPEAWEREQTSKDFLLAVYDAHEGQLDYEQVRMYKEEGADEDFAPPVPENVEELLVLEEAEEDDDDVKEEDNDEEGVPVVGEDDASDSDEDEQEGHVGEGDQAAAPGSDPLEGPSNEAYRQLVAKGKATQVTTVTGRICAGKVSVDSFVQLVGGRRKGRGVQHGILVRSIYHGTKSVPTAHLGDFVTLVLEYVTGSSTLSVRDEEEEEEEEEVVVVAGGADATLTIEEKDEAFAFELLMEELRPVRVRAGMTVLADSGRQLRSFSNMIAEVKLSRCPPTIPYGSYMLLHAGPARIPCRLALSYPAPDTREALGLPDARDVQDPVQWALPPSGDADGQWNGQLLLENAYPLVVDVASQAIHVSVSLDPVSPAAPEPASTIVQVQHLLTGRPLKALMAEARDDPGAVEEQTLSTLVHRKFPNHVAEVIMAYARRSMCLVGRVTRVQPVMGHAHS